MKKLLSFTFLAMLLSFASFALSPISGPSTGCIGSIYYFSDADSLGSSVWTTSDSTIATISPYGMLVAEATGTVTITYYYGGSFVTTSFTVEPSSAPISATSTSFCLGASATCTDATTGGTWSSSNPGVATVSATGVVTGINNGIAYIYYTSTEGCTIGIADTVNATNAGYLPYLYPLCAGSEVDLGADTSAGLGTAYPTGGTWSSSDPAVASINSGGLITTIAAGTATISYAVSGICGTAYATTTFDVSSTTSAGTIVGTGDVIVGLTTDLYVTGASGSGTWSSSDPSIADIGPYGVVTGISTGSVTITYTVDGCGGTATTTGIETVNALNGISGYVNFDSYPYSNIKVWLITYNPSTLDLEASDSVTLTGGSMYYQFTGLATDSFRIKAAVTDTSYMSLNYVPTYHTSSYFWGDANVVYHTAGGSDINENINMAFDSTYVPGAGFIGGNVTTGANKGTSGSIPAVGLLIYCINTASGALMQQTYTDASGNYSFSNLPLGGYTIYPEAINYNTTAYTSITLSTTTPSMAAASFVQHTLSKTITPVTESVATVAAAISSVTTFPNPAANTLHILWNAAASEKGTIMITDITGREMYKTNINMAPGNGASQVDLSAFANGLYIITVKSADIDYTGKIQVQH